MSRFMAVISDTHGLLRPEVMKKIQNADVILHAGDINDQKILDELNHIAPVYAVRGNNDKEWAEDLPLFLELEMEGRKIYMVHNKKDLPKDLSAYDLVIYGHSHKYFYQESETTYFLNPGSCGKRRFDQEITFALINMDKDKIDVEKVTIPH